MKPSRSSIHENRTPLTAHRPLSVAQLRIAKEVFENEEIGFGEFPEFRIGWERKPRFLGFVPGKVTYGWFDKHGNPIPNPITGSINDAILYSFNEGLLMAKHGKHKKKRPGKKK